jgi:c(7)-type cytochrome triheme protein
MRAIRVMLAVPVVVVLLAGAVAAGSKLRGRVTAVDAASETITVDGHRVSIRGLRVIGASLEPGAWVKIDGARVKVKPQRPAANDEVIRYAPADPANPGRVEFSHLRHVNALGEKRCAACHSPEMKLRAPGGPPPRAAASSAEPHAPTSRGRFCASCHDGKTAVSAAGQRGGGPDFTVFTTAKTSDPRSCERCHAPRDHGRDFTPAHGEVAEHGGQRGCVACHRQNWAPEDRQRQAALLAAERTLAVNPDDPEAALVVGPNNFCVSCHRTDDEWR